MSLLNPRLLFLNLGHALDHLFMLLFAAVVITMGTTFNATYGELIALSTPGFIAFGAFALPAGWLGDRYGRPLMMTVFFIGIGLASIFTGFADSKIELAVGLFLIGLFAAIYHPVGIAMVAEGGGQIGQRLGINGVFGNLGVAASALVAGILADVWGWRAAFLVPGAVTVLIGIAFAMTVRATAASAAAAKKSSGTLAHPDWRRVLLVVAVATACGGFIFNVTTVSLPKVFDERLAGLASSASALGAWVSIVYTVAAFAQVVVGWAIDRYPIKPIMMFLVTGQAVLLAIAVQADQIAMLAVALILMLMVFGQIPITDALIARHTPDGWRGRVYAGKYAISFGVAAAAVPSIAYLHEFGGGFATLFVVTAVAAAVISAATVALPGGFALRRAAPAAAE